MGRMVMFAKNKQETCFKWVEGLQDNINDINKKLERVVSDVKSTRKRRKKRKTRKLEKNRSRRKKNRHDGDDGEIAVPSLTVDVIEPAVVNS
mgnify:CR=1 FL=1